MKLLVALLIVGWFTCGGIAAFLVESTRAAHMEDIALGPISLSRTLHS